MSGTNIVLDTNIVLYLLNGDTTLGEYLENKNVYVSFITEMRFWVIRELQKMSKRQLLCF